MALLDEYADGNLKCSDCNNGTGDGSLRKLEGALVSIQELIGGKQIPTEGDKDDSWQSKICSNCKNVIIYCFCSMEDAASKTDDCFLVIWKNGMLGGRVLSQLTTAITDQ